MLFIKLGILVLLGKQFYTPFIFASMFGHLTQAAKMKLREVVK
jgi:hypothetical protein